MFVFITNRESYQIKMHVISILLQYLCPVLCGYGYLYHHNLLCTPVCIPNLGKAFGIPLDYFMYFRVDVGGYSVMKGGWYLVGGWKGMEDAA